MILHEPPQILDRSDFRVNGMIQQLRAKIGEAVTVLFLHVNLYFSMVDLGSGWWKCEPGFGDLFRLIGDASVSARPYQSKGVAGIRRTNSVIKPIHEMQNAAAIFTRANDRTIWKTASILLAMSGVFLAGLFLGQSTGESSR